MKMVISVRGVIFVAALALSVFLSAAEARAETIGVILTADVPFYQEIHEAMLSELSREGKREGLTFLIQKPYADPISWSNAARKFEAAGVDLLLVYGTAPYLAVMRERPSIPVLYAGVYGPAIEKDRSPRSTGICQKPSISSLIRYLRSTSSFSRLGVLYSKLEEDSNHELETIKELSKRYGFEVVPLSIRSGTDVSAALSQNDCDALFITTSSVVNSLFPHIIRASMNHSIPTASMMSYGDLHALVTLSTDPREQGRKMAAKMLDILGGKRLANIKEECATEVRLVFNLRDARRMGLKISMDLVTQATEIIQ